MKKFAFSNPLKEKILKASSGLIIINLFGKLLGYVEKLFLAKYFGTGYEVDVYTVIITIVFSFFYFFREVVEPSFLRVFLEKESQKNGEEWQVFNFGIRIISVSTIVISLLIFIYPENTIRLFAPGFNGEKFELASSLLKKTIVSCVFLSLSTLTNIILNAKKYFVYPALGDLLFKTSIIVAFFIIDIKDGILGIGIAIAIASLLKLGVHLIFLLKRISFRRISLQKETKYSVFRLSAPLLIGILFSQLSGIIDNGFASNLQEGAIASISYAKKIIELPIVILPYVLSVVVFPFFSEFSIQKETEKLHQLFTEILWFIIIIFVPLTIFFALNNYDIVSVIFKRGAFDQNSVELTSTPLFIYALGLLFFAIEAILVIYYFSQADTKTPILVGIVCVLINIFLTWFLVKRLGYLSIPIAYIIQKTLKTIWLLFLKSNDLRFLARILKEKGIFFLVAVISFVLGAVVWRRVSKEVSFVNHELMNSVLILGVSFFISFSVYFIILWRSNTLNLNRLLNK